jgi:hypothetical protein
MEVIRETMRKYYITESLGEVRKRTPEGYLLCVGVPIARTGEYEYAAHEMPGFEPDEDGIVLCERPAEVVFSDTAIASFEGKPFVSGHPDESVDVTNWSEYAAGVIQNVRKGEGSEADLLIADILVTRPDVIEEINSGVREVSCGYDAEYTQASPGRARLKNIVGNHVALVELGRAGPRVAIGDGARKNGNGGNSKVDGKGKRMKAWDWLRDAFERAKDEGIVLEIGASGNSPADPDPSEDESAFNFEEAFDSLGTRFDGLTSKLDELIGALRPQSSQLEEDSGEEKEELEELEELLGDESGEEETPESGVVQTPPAGDARKTGDARPGPAKIRNAWNARTADARAAGVKTANAKAANAGRGLVLDAGKVMAFRRAAEILAPGFGVGSLTLDSPASLTDAMRKVLAEACLRDDSIRRGVEEARGEVVRSWTGVEDAEVRILFADAAREKGRRNNGGARVGVRDFAVVGGLDVPDIQKSIREFWNKKEA